MQLLVIEPDEYAAKVVEVAARRRDHTVLLFSAVSELPSRLPFDPTVIVLSITSAEWTNPEALRSLSDRYPFVPVIATSEASSSAVHIFEAGATQLVSKPFHPTELIARAEALAKREVRREVASDAIREGDLDVDLTRYVARKGGRTLRLTKLELRLLYSLLRHHASVSPTDTLLTFGWDSGDPPNESLLKTHISHLRSKLRDAGGLPVSIRSRHSLGYVLTVEQPVERHAASAVLAS